MDFHKMIENHKACGADISIATIPVGDREAPWIWYFKSKWRKSYQFFIEKTFHEIS